MPNMQYTSTYKTPLGNIFLAADDTGLTGLWFEGAKYFASNLSSEHTEKELPIFEEVKSWLDIYFLGREPEFMTPIHLIGTPFQLDVWDVLQKIPYGKTITYAEIAGIIARKRGLSRMSAQAVGGAVRHNPVSIIVPCHRVVGANGSLTGYAGGLDKKAALLMLESEDR